jgi:hypothetical protein
MVVGRVKMGRIPGACPRAQTLSAGWSKATIHVGGPSSGILITRLVQTVLVALVREQSFLGAIPKVPIT